jgi:hypothetical protein
MAERSSKRGKSKDTKLKEEMDRFLKIFQELSSKEKTKVLDSLISNLTNTICLSTRHRYGVVALDRMILEKFDMSLAQYVRLCLNALASAYLEGGEAEANRLLSYLEKKVRKNADRLIELGGSDKEIEKSLRQE